MIGNRQGLAVWLHSLKYARQLRKYGNVHYVSKKMKYAIIYCEKEEVDTVMERLQSLHFIKEVKPSMRPFIKTEYENSRPDKEKEKEYGYRMGL
ncbi:YlbG family protein [Anaerobacillus sp. MEB173]|uniref:YlbG family protein n=1 Tax=Anaerobacillus sp. MEB173 TaxID=3383345 RepID=UPI003F8FEC8A